jgi:hypothetical protein
MFLNVTCRTFTVSFSCLQTRPRIAASTIRGNPVQIFVRRPFQRGSVEGFGIAVGVIASFGGSSTARAEERFADVAHPSPQTFRRCPRSVETPKPVPASVQTNNARSLP